MMSRQLEALKFSVMAVRPIATERNPCFASTPAVLALGGHSHVVAFRSVEGSDEELEVPPIHGAEDRLVLPGLTQDVPGTDDRCGVAESRDPSVRHDSEVGVKEGCHYSERTVRVARQKVEKPRKPRPGGFDRLASDR